MTENKEQQKTVTHLGVSGMVVFFSFNATPSPYIPLTLQALSLQSDKNRFSMIHEDR